MGDSLLVQGINDDVDGVYVIKDKTHKRFKNRIDILVKKGKLYGKWKNVKIRKWN
jgi:3D (Asp-Asp-Asp) domain-containing protein